LLFTDAISVLMDSERTVEAVNYVRPGYRSYRAGGTW